MDKVLAVNSGSSSLKFKLFEMPSEAVIASGLIERIAIPGSQTTIKYGNGKVYKLGDTVRIFVDNVNTDRGEIDFLLADFSPYQGQD